MKTFVLYMVMMSVNANWSTGGPLIVENFKTKEECIAFSDKIIRETPKKFEVELVFGTSVWSNRFPVVTCLEKQ